MDKFQEFDLSLRGEIDVKGKGKMTTYWLIGMRKQNQRFANINNIENKFAAEMSNDFAIDDSQQEYLTETKIQPNNSTNISFEDDFSMAPSSVQTN